MNELIEVIPFKNRIYVVDIEQDCSIYIPNIRELKLKTESVTYSNKGGWQSPSYTYDSNEFCKPILDLIKPYVFMVYERMQVLGNGEVFYWFNVNNKHNYNTAHRHGFSYYSAVLYLRTPKNCGNLNFLRPDDAHSWIPHKTCDVDGNWDTYHINAEPNRLIIFPSYLMHYVEQNLTDDSDDERISMALNFR